MACTLLACQPSGAPTTMNADNLHPQLAQAVVSMVVDTVDIEQTRQSELNALAQWVAEELVDSGQVDLTFICTHNSRRSQPAGWVWCCDDLQQRRPRMPGGVWGGCAVRDTLRGSKGQRWDGRRGGHL